MKFGKRHILAAWLFTGFINLYVLRISISVAIVSMVNHTKIERSTTALSQNDSCPFPDEKAPTKNLVKQAEFDWSPTTQGVILGSFFYGYVCTQLLGGVLSRQIGVRILFGIAIGGSSILSLLTPLAARTSIALLITLRVLAGVVQGVSFPCGSFILSNWAPKQERSVLATMPPTGGSLGTILAAPLTGLLCDYGFDGGWPSAFYVTGIMGLLWTMGWFYVARDTPAQHSTISVEERRYIEENCQAAVKPVPLKSLPWKTILLSRPVWSLILANFSFGWTFNTMLLGVSTYLKTVLHISASLTGLFTALPFLVKFLVELLTAFFSDYLISKGLRISIVRKAFYCFGLISSAIVLTLISLVGCNMTLVVVLLCAAIGITGCSYTSFIVNHNDIAPQYAGILMGLSNSFGSMNGVMAPLVTGYVIREQSTVATWQIVFYIGAAISLFGAAAFALFGEGEVQAWAVVRNFNVINPKDQDKTSGEDEEASALQSLKQ